MIVAPLLDRCAGRSALILVETEPSIGGPWAAETIGRPLGLCGIP